MRGMRRILANVVVGALALWSAAPAFAEPFRVGIANFGEDPALLLAIEGFRKALGDAGFEEGKDVAYTISHTNFDATLVPQMLAALQAERPRLIFTLTTPVSQIAKRNLARSGIPIVFGAVTDPVAAELVPSWTSGAPSMTGASDLQDVGAVMSFARQLLPAAQSFGLPYNPGEANDRALLDIVEATGRQMGFTIVSVGVDSVNDIPQRIASLKGRADVIYVPTSNLLQPAVNAVAASARQAGIPVINASDDPVKKGVVPASFAIDYGKVGYNAGLIALKVLEGADPQSIPPVRPAYEDHAPVISKRGLAAFGIALPDGLANCGCLVD
jgi:putative ABC transport system substrate-binding protein